MRMINCNVVVHDNYHRCIRKLWHSKDKVMMMLGGKLLPGWSVVGIYALVEDDQSSLISRGSSRSPFTVRGLGVPLILSPIFVYCPREIAELVTRL